MEEATRESDKGARTSNVKAFCFCHYEKTSTSNRLYWPSRGFEPLTCGARPVQQYIIIAQGKVARHNQWILQSIVSG